MSWKDRIESIRAEVSTLKQDAELSDPEIASRVKPIIESGGMGDESDYTDDHIDTHYRLAWWLVVGAQSLVAEDDEADEQAWVSQSVDDVVNEESSFEELFDELSEMESQKSEAGEGDVIDLVLRAAKQLEDTSGEELRESVVNAIHRQDQAGDDAPSFNRALMHLYNYLPNLLDGLVQTVEAYRRGDLDEAAEMLPLLTEGIEWTVKGLLSSKDYLEKWGIEVDVEHFNYIFEEVVEAMENRDAVYLPDLMEHELFPLFYEYHKRIEEVLTLSGITDTLLEENLDSFAQINANAVEKIRSVSEKDSDLEIELDRADDGGRSLRVTNDRGKYYLCSPYNPGMEANQWVEQLTEKRVYPVVVVFGFGLGYRIRELIEELPEDFSLVIVEPSAALIRSVLNTVNCADIVEDPRVRFIVEDSNDVESVFKELVSWKNIAQTTVTHLPNYPQVFPKEYSEFAEKMRKAMTVPVGMRATHYVRSRSWVENSIENIPELFDSRSIAELQDSFEGKPAIVVAAGPSLDKNVDLLKEVKGKAFIICVDTALQILQYHDIEPDIVITIDPGAKNYNDHLKGREYDDVPLASMYRAHHEILSDHDGRKFIITDETDMQVLGQFLNAAGIGFNMSMFPGGGSVAHWGLSLARLVSADPVVFVGQDLAYTGEVNYAEGVESKRESYQASSEDFYAEGVGGEKVVTAHQWYVFLVQFEEMLATDESGRTYIDATEGGLKIEGTEIKTLRETIDEYMQEEIGVQARMDDAWENSEGVNIEDGPALRRELEKGLDDIDEYREELEEAIELCDELQEIYSKGKENLTRSDRTRADQILDELEAIDEEVQDSKGITLIFIMTNAISDFVNNLYTDYRHRVEEQRDPELIARISRFLYDSLIDAFDFVSPKLERVIGEIEELEEAAGVEELEDDSDTHTIEAS